MSRRLRSLAYRPIPSLRAVVVFASLVLAVSALACADDAADAIINQGIKALGGEAMLTKARATTSKVKGTDDAGEFNIEHTTDGRGRMRITFERDSGGNKFTVVTVIDGDKGWIKEGEMEVRELEGEELVDQKWSQFSGSNRTNCLNARTALLVATLVALPLTFSLAAEPEPKREAAAAVLHGRVRNEGGKPLAGVLVRIAIPAMDMRFAIGDNDHKQFEAISGDDGEYRLEIPGIAKPTTISIDAMKPGHRRLSGTLMSGGDAPLPEVAPGVVTETNLLLPAALYFKGIVVDEEGKPIRSVEIGAYASTRVASGGVERTMSNQDGEFELFNYDKSLTLGNEVARGRVEFSHPDFVSRTIDDVYSLPENERSAMRVELPTGCKIVGTVRDMTGNPVPHVMVKASHAMGFRLKATMTDSKGRFALKGIAEGPTALSVHALDLHQKIQMPLALDSDINDLDVRLREISLPPDLKSVAVLGMKLTDLTPELKTAYDLWHDRGALILDPGPDSERLDIGTLAHGYSFWMVGNKRIASVHEFVEQILVEAEAQRSEPYSIRVVYSFSNLEGDGNNTQYLRLSKDDIAPLKALVPRLIGSPAPELSGEVWLNADEPPTWKSLRGGPVLLVFFDLRQRSFLALVPPLLGFRETYGKQGLAVIGLYAKAPRDEIAKHLADEGITFPVLIDDGKTAERYKVGSSACVLIDREGKVVSVHKHSLAPPADIEKLIGVKNDTGD